MKNNILTIGLIVFIIIVGAVVYSYKQAGNSIKNKEIKSVSLIQIEPLSYNFGQVKLGKVAEKEFLVKNLSNDDQKIVSVATSCGCTKAQIEKKDIKSQESVKLKVIFDSGTHGKSGLGENNQIVYLKFKNPEIGEIEIEIHADVIE
jgi:uncharacterized protein YpmB